MGGRIRVRLLRLRVRGAARCRLPRRSADDADTAGLAGIANGPGKYVTIYDRTVATVRVWVKKKKIVTVKQAKNPDAAGVHVVKGRQANSNTVSIQLPRWVGEWTTLHLTKLVPSADTTNNDEHVIIDLDGQWWESGGSTADGGAETCTRSWIPTPAT